MIYYVNDLIFFSHLSVDCVLMSVRTLKLQYGCISQGLPYGQCSQQRELVTKARPTTFHLLCTLKGINSKALFNFTVWLQYFNNNIHE